MIERGGATLLIAVRLIPIVPFSLVSYAAGAARVPPWRFAWTTAVGYLPITALAVYFGTRLEGLSLTDPLVLGSAAALLALLLRGPLDPAPPVAAPGADSAAPPTRLTLKRKVAGVLSTLPAASTAIARITWRPTPNRLTRRCGQKRTRPPSTRQVKVEPGSLEAKRKTALRPAACGCAASCAACCGRRSAGRRCRR